MSITILGIESSCDDTSAAILRDGVILSSVIANQEIHETYGGVVPELASRAHQQNILPVVDIAINKAKIKKEDIDAIAFTRGPGLLGSLLVGTSFAKGLSLSLKVPLIEVNHLQAHVLVHFIKEAKKQKTNPKFPFLCLLVSGGHTQIVLVKDYLKMEIIGQTIDDAAGEAFDKCGKVMGLKYPAGPEIDKLAKNGDPLTFKFSKPNIPDIDFSYSGLKTSFLYFIRDELKTNPKFIQENLNDLCASIQHTIIEILIDKILLAAKSTKNNHIAIGGGVSANSYLRNQLRVCSKTHNWQIYLPEKKYTTDNAAMIAITGYYKFMNNMFVNQGAIPEARYKF